MKIRVSKISKHSRMLIMFLLALDLACPSALLFSQDTPADDPVKAEEKTVEDTGNKVSEKIQEKIKNKTEEKTKEKLQEKVRDTIKDKTRKTTTDTGSKIKNAGRKAVEWTKKHPYIAGGTAVGVVGVAAIAGGGGGGGGGGTFDPAMAGTYRGSGTETLSAMGESMTQTGPVTVTITADGQVTFLTQVRQASGLMNGNSFSIPIAVDIGGSSVTINVNGTVSDNRVNGTWSGSGTAEGISFDISGSYSAIK